MKRKIIRWYRKWIKGECRHVCRLCKHRYYCWMEFPQETHYYIIMGGRGNGRTYYLKQKLNELYGIKVSRMLEGEDKNHDKTTERKKQN